MWWTALLLLLVIGPADAKKPKKDKAQPTAAPTLPVATGQVVSLPCNYEPGTTWRFVREETTIDTRPGLPEDRVVTREEFTIRVDRWDGKVVTATWEVIDESLVDPPNDPLKQRLFAAMMEEAEQLDDPVLEYSHEAGMVRVTNVDALVGQSAQMMEALRPLLLEMVAAAPEDKRADLVDRMVVMATNPVVVTKSLIEGGQPLFAYTCVDLVSGSYEYASQLPSPFTPEPLSAKGTIVLGDAEPDRVRWVDALVLDPIGTKQILDAIVQLTGAPLPPEADLQDLQVDVSMRYDIAVSPADGWPIGWTAERRTGAAGSLKVERTVVTRQK